MNWIILVLLSEIDEHILDVLRQNLEQTFNCPMEIRSSIRSLKYAYNPLRKQYISPRLISRLRRIERGSGEKILGIVDVDLYSPRFDFVFGEAEIASGVATLSLYRLRPKHYGFPPDVKTFEDRVIKEATHELGHLYQLGHCSNPKCVIYFSTSVIPIDKKLGTFCPKCQKELMDNMA